MIIFFIVAALMLVVALAFVLVPLLINRDASKTGQGQAAQAAISDDASNLAIYRAQKQELDDDVTRGIISATERDAALAELSARVVSEVAESSNVATTTLPVANEKRAWIAAMCLAMAIPVVAILGYVVNGSPQAISNKFAAASVSATANNAASAVSTASDAQPENQTNGEKPKLTDDQIRGMVDSLAIKMEAQPNEPTGWVLLARSQKALGRYPDAARSYERAIKLLPKDAQVVADYADVLVVLQQGRFDGKPYQMISQALKLDGNNVKALALAGTAEMRLGNRAASVKHWQKLKTLVALDSDDYREIESIIADINSKPEGTPIPAVAANPAINAAPDNAATNTAASSPAAAFAKGTNGVNGFISGTVTIAPDVASKIAAGDTLFVLARAAGGPNAPRMPLAVLRIPAPQKWPYQFSLTDAMAMAPGMNLSSFPEVSIEARLSKSGGATQQSGDLFGQVTPVKLGANNLAIVISRVVP